MKLLLALCLATVVGFSSIASAQEGTMKEVAEKMIAYEKLSKDYSLVEIKKLNIRGSKFQTRLNTLTRAAVKKFEGLLESEESDHLTAEQKRKALAKPAEYLGVTYLMEITEVKAVYYRGELIGYRVEVADHVQAAIYQDGAGIRFYLDLNLRVVAEDEWSA